MLRLRVNLLGAARTPAGNVMARSASEKHLIDAVYASLGDDALLRDALIACAKHLNASGANIHVADPSDSRSVLFLPWGANYTPSAINAYFDHWRPINVHRRMMRRHRTIFLCREHLDADAIRTSTYLNEFYFPIGERWLAGAVSPVGTRHEISLVFNRAQGDPPFDAAAARFIEDLAPHVHRIAAANTDLNLHAGATGLRNALAAWSQPVWLVDRHARPLWMNDAAEALLSQGCPFRLEGGRLSSRCGTLAEGLTERLAAIAASAPSDAFARQSELQDASGVWTLELMPAISARDGAQATALILGRLVRRLQGAYDRLRTHCGLTIAEAEIAINFADGHSVQQISEMRGVSIKTVRTQVRAILEKMEASSLIELVSKIWKAAQ